MLQVLKIETFLFLIVFASLILYVKFLSKLTGLVWQVVE